MPESVISTAKDLWAILLGIGALVAWFFRLEARAIGNSKEVASKADKKDVDRYREEFKEYVISMKEQRAEDLARHQREQSSLQSQLNSMHKDIRLLIERTAAK